MSNSDLIKNEVRYVGRDLEAMSFAVNYHRWILSVFKPYLGKRLVEVGAGTGSFSELLLEHSYESLALVEPSTAMFSTLKKRIERLQPVVPIEIYNSVFADAAPQIKARHQPDSVIYVNVLEHIRDDEMELRLVREILDLNGRVFIFVPALPQLYGRFDETIGHFRRYTKDDLENKCRRNGLDILKSTYFDLAGVIPWWVQFRLLKVRALKPEAVKFYDTYVVPLTKAVETVLKPPLGKNLLVVAEKSDM